MLVKNIPVAAVIGFFLAVVIPFGHMCTFALYNIFAEIWVPFNADALECG